MFPVWPSKNPGFATVPTCLLLQDLNLLNLINVSLTHTVVAYSFAYRFDHPTALPSFAVTARPCLLWLVLCTRLSVSSISAESILTHCHPRAGLFPQSHDKPTFSKSRGHELFTLFGAFSKLDEGELFAGLRNNYH